MICRRLTVRFPRPWIRPCAVVSMAAMLGFSPMVWAQQQGNPITNAAADATARRQQQIVKTQEAVLQGDRLMANKDYGGAVATYRQAFLTAPSFANGAAVRQEAYTKYQEALRLHADQLAKTGRSKEALQQLTQFFFDARDQGMPPNSFSPDLGRIKRDLEQGEVYEPALTVKHVEDRGKVEKWLKDADAHFRIGRFDEANALYNQVLNVDNTNSAARVGLMEVEMAQAQHYKVAHDSMRGEALAKVAAAWEQPLQNIALAPLPSQNPNIGLADGDHSIRAKLNTIVFPEVDLSQTPLRDALAYIVQESRNLDTLDPDPLNRGINIVLSNEDPSAAYRPVTLQIRQITLGQLLGYVTQQVNMKYRIDQSAVTVLPVTSVDGTDLVLKRYSVPPNFLSGGTMNGGADAGDPFANPAPGGSTTLKPLLTAEEFLKQNGIEFPPGASATFIPQASILLVRNTQSNLELVDAMVQNSFGDVTKLLKIDVRLLEISETKLKEFGFDWLLGQFNLPGSDRAYGSGGTAGTQPGILSEDFPFVPPGTFTPVGSFPVTAGNRSGTLTDLGDSVDAEINRGQATTVPSGRRAPGVFAISGVFTDPQFQVVLRAVDQKFAGDVGTVTSVVTRSGQIASIRNVREFIYPSEYDPPEMSEPLDVEVVVVGGVPTTPTGYDPSFLPVTPAHPTAFEMREVGSILEVEGTIGPDNLTIGLNLTPSLSRFEGFINYGSPFRTIDAFGTTIQNVENRILMPVFRSTKETTQLDVFDGQTIVIGGLTEERVGKTADKTPILGDAPLVGRFFRMDVERREKRAVVFFVTVNIIDPSGKPLSESSQHASVTP